MGIFLIKNIFLYEMFLCAINICNKKEVCVNDAWFLFESSKIRRNSRCEFRPRFPSHPSLLYLRQKKNTAEAENSHISIHNSRKYSYTGITSISLGGGRSASSPRIHYRTNIGDDICIVLSRGPRINI